MNIIAQIDIFFNKCLKNISYLRYSTLFLPNFRWVGSHHCQKILSLWLLNTPIRINLYSNITFKSGVFSNNYLFFIPYKILI